MEPIKFEGVNKTFTGPDAPGFEGTLDLPVYMGNIQGTNQPVIISAWQPSEQDLENLKAGKPIYLWIYGQGMPVVALDTTNPFQ
jgi:hypothetical protein